MSKVYLFSDPHFGHANVILNLRHFRTVEEHDELIVTNWNKTVTKRDIVYLLGDVTMENKKYEILSRLNGTIYVIGGNHDMVKHSAELMKYVTGIGGTVDYKGFQLTHVPIHPREFYSSIVTTKRIIRANIHGHVHAEYMRDNFGRPDYNYINVSAEVINYTPIPFEIIEKYHVFIKTRDTLRNEDREQLCYCGHTNYCTCGNPTLQMFRENYERKVICNDYCTAHS